jgi:membrane fusion protein, multidrug efflux system
MAGRSWLGWAALAAVLATYAGSQRPEVAAVIAAARDRVIATLPAGLTGRGTETQAPAGGPAATGQAAAAPKTAGAAGPPGKRQTPPAPVLTEKAKIANMPLRLEGVGSVMARSTVAIKARIDGQLMEAAVKEGQTVKKGDLLFKLDARPLDAALKVAEANLARDKANLEKAKADFGRIGDLASKGFSPKSKYDESKASRH